MKRQKLVRYLRRHGCELLREGSAHSIYRNPTNARNVAVPRHVEIDNVLAKEICKQLGIEPVQ